MNDAETDHVLSAISLAQLAMQARDVELGQMIHAVSSDGSLPQVTAALAGLSASILRLLPQQAAKEQLDAWRQAALIDNDLGDDAA